MAVVAHVGDVGLVIKGTVKDENGAVVSIAAATTKNILLMSPAGAVSTKAGVFPAGETGVEGNLQYATVAGDLSVRGTWRAEIHIITPTREYHSSIHDFEVEDYLA